MVMRGGAQLEYDRSEEARRGGVACTAPSQPSRASQVPPTVSVPTPPPLAVRPDCQEPSGGAIHDGYGPRTLREREIRREMQ